MIGLIFGLAFGFIGGMVFGGWHFSRPWKKLVKDWRSLRREHMDWFHADRRDAN